MGRRRKRRSPPPLVCQIAGSDGRTCNARIAWIPGVAYAVNPGKIEILLYESGSPRIEGVTLQGDEVWGRKRKPEESGRVAEVWTRHTCEHKAGRPVPRPAPDPERKWGADRAAGQEADE